MIRRSISTVQLHTFLRLSKPVMADEAFSMVVKFKFRCAVWEVAKHSAWVLRLFSAHVSAVVVRGPFTPAYPGAVVCYSEVLPRRAIFTGSVSGWWCPRELRKGRRAPSDGPESVAGPPVVAEVGQ